jgi:hypothetical protein
MFHLKEKGTNMIHIKQSSKIRRADNGIFAGSRAIFLHLAGSASRSHRSGLTAWTIVIRGVVGAVLVAAVGTLLLACPAFAAKPPLFENLDEPILTIAHSTRVTIRALVDSEGLTAEWTAEYAPAEKNGEAPPENSPSWIVVNDKEKIPQGQSLIFIGSPNSPGPAEAGGALSTYLRHLAPDTSYYARFIVDNKEGKATETVPFKTLPLGRPEVPLLYLGPYVTSGRPWFVAKVGSDSTAAFSGVVESNGTETTYQVEYSLPEDGHAPAATSASWKSFNSGGSGTITPAQEYTEFEARVAGLTPETTYYARLRASNEQGEIIQSTFENRAINESSTFTTLTAKPFVESPGARNITGTSAHLTTQIAPQGFRTVWRFESAPSEAGPWTPVPGAAGSISQEQAEATPYDDGVAFDAGLSGLSASTVYYIRVVAENECGEGCGRTTSPVEHFETVGSPSATAFAVHTLDGESLRLLGAVNPHSVLTSAEQEITIEGAPTGGAFTLTFMGQTTGLISYNASDSVVENALDALAAIGHGGVTVTGPPGAGSGGGPYTVYFIGQNAEKTEPLLEADGMELAPPGTVSVVTTQQGGVGYDAHYRFQYVSQTGFGERGWTGAEESPEVDLGSGDSSQIVGYDLPSLTPGETYRYRIVASSTAPGVSLVVSGEQSLTIPLPSNVDEAAACPNEAFRTGLSAHLPDCRAYEMVTPVDKEGAQEPFHYGGGIDDDAVVGEDGEHVALDAAGVFWGKGPGSGTSPYLFTRGAGGGWLMSSGSPEPETGVYSNTPEIYSADLTQYAFSSQYNTSAAGESPAVDFKVGPVGGPYTTVASVPHQFMKSLDDGWVAANGDFSKLVLGSEDRTLLGEGPTPTKSGVDLYEYTAQGGLHQLNVSGESDTTIGSCGASMVRGQQAGAVAGRVISARNISADGSRVFFEAVPGKNCSEAPNLYMRVDGVETVDIGAYQFIAANSEGTTLLLKDGAGNLVGYDTETGATQTQSSGELATAAELALFHIPYTPEPRDDNPFYHPRYTYSSLNSGGEQYAIPAISASSGQIYRYDNVEHIVQCVSCASPFNAKPAAPALLDGVDGMPELKGGSPEYTAVSANGEFAFFTTTAALVPQDVDGEIEVDGGEPLNLHQEYLDTGNSTSPSSDIYEWRADGVDGCAHRQGCLALITDGRGGYMNLLLGSADEGRDVFIYSRSVLSPGAHGAEGSIGEGNIYDVRIDGGEPPLAQRPVECEGDSCSSPLAAPSDATPSSLTFTGEGDVKPAPAAKPVVKSTKPKTKSEKKTKKRSQRKSKKKRKAKKSAKSSRGGKKS